MKKLLLTIAAITIMSCSKDDNNSNDCVQKVWTANTSTVGTTTTYSISVGQNSNDVEDIVVSQSVFNYYSAQIQNGDRCYEGTNVGL